MKIDAADRSRLRIHLLPDKSGNDPCQGIAHTACRHAGISGHIHISEAIFRGDDGRHALQDERHSPIHRKSDRTIDALSFRLSRRPSRQMGKFPHMRRQDQLAGAAGEIDLHLLHRIQRICIDNDRLPPACEDLLHEALRLCVTAKPRADGEHIIGLCLLEDFLCHSRREEIRIPHGRNHELGHLARYHSRRLWHSHDSHLAGPGMERALSGEERRPLHAGRAGDDADESILSFMTHALP